MRDLADGSALRLGPDGANIVIDGEVVSTSDRIDAEHLVLALGGEPVSWFGTVLAARTVLADMERVNAHLPDGDIIWVLRQLCRPEQDRIQAVSSSRSSGHFAAWRRVAQSVDPCLVVRGAVAATASRLPPSTRTIVLGHLLDTHPLNNDPDLLVIRYLLDQPAVLADDAVCARLANHPAVKVRGRLAWRLPARSPWLTVLADDTNEHVVRAAMGRLAREVDEADEKLCAALGLG